MNPKNREKQRYSLDGAREVAVALIFAPIRLATHRSVSSSSQQSRLAMMFVSSRNHPHQLTPPKGGWEFDESVEGAAMREAAEEGGMIAQPLNSADCAIGHPVFLSGKSSSPCALHGVVLRHVSLEDSYLESRERVRFCIPVDDLKNCDLRLVDLKQPNAPPEQWAIKKDFFSLIHWFLRQEGFVEKIANLIE